MAPETQVNLIVTIFKNTDKKKDINVIQVEVFHQANRNIYADENIKQSFVYEKKNYLIALV